MWQTNSRLRPFYKQKGLVILHGFIINICREVETSGGQIFLMVFYDFYGKQKLLNLRHRRFYEQQIYKQTFSHEEHVIMQVIANVYEGLF